MRFICRYDDYKHQIYQGAYRRVGGVNGTSELEWLSEPIVAEFRRGLLTAAEREAARQVFDGQVSSIFAHEAPGAPRTAGILGSGADELEGVFYQGSDAAFLYSVFDTEDEQQCDPAFRDAYEAVLLGDRDLCEAASKRHNWPGKQSLNPSTDAGRDVLEVSALMERVVAIETPNGIVVTAREVLDRMKPRWSENFPWPTYGDLDMRKEADKAKLVEIADTIGIPRIDIARFEAEHRQRPTVVAALLGISTEEATAAITEFQQARAAASERKFAAVQAPTKWYAETEDAPRQMSAQEQILREEPDGIDFRAFVSG